MTCREGNQDVTISNAAILRKYDLNERSPTQSKHGYCHSKNMTNVTEYDKAAIFYIAVYVAKMVVKLILCRQFCEALGSTTFAAKSIASS